ncbi:sulfatase [Bacteroidota bacterium]
MKFRSKLLPVFLIFLSLALRSCNTNTGNKQGIDDRPNILLIVADDHGSTDAGCYGNTAIHTPNIDYLASEGVRMTSAFCTTASCSASRSVILTGLYNHANGQYGHEHGVYHFSAFPDIKSLPVLLEESGYATARIGKYHVAPESVFHFQEVFSGVSQRSPVEMADKCREFIEKSEAPFFLYYATSDPHRGGGVNENIVTKPDRFGNLDVGYPGIKEVVFSSDEVIVPPYLPETIECRDELTQYYQSVARLDQGIGRLVELLKETGKWDNTIVMYISDNGIAFPGAKTNLYDPAMRLPCIVKLPNSKNAGTVSDAMVNWAYITPTLLDFAGILPGGNFIPGSEGMQEKNPLWRPPKFIRFHGRSFRDVLVNGTFEGFDEIYASHTFHEITMYYPMRVVQDRKYKLIWNIASGLSYPHASDLWESSTWQSAVNSGTGLYAKRGIEAYSYRAAFELFDMQNDPDEIRNLAYDPDFADVLGSMKDKLRIFQERTSDPWRVKWEHE